MMMSQSILLASDTLLFCAAKDKHALEQHIQSLLQHSVWDEAFVVAQHSQVDATSTCRLFVIADDFIELRQRVEKSLASLQRGVRREGRIGKGIFYNSNSTAKQGGIAFVFPGQGCQFPSMGSMLAKRYPTVEARIKRLDEALLDTVGEKVSGYYYEGKYTKELHPKLFDLDIGACVVNTLSLAYHELLARVGIQADVYLGHSTGEFTALMASGRMIGGDDSVFFANILNDFIISYRDISQKYETPKGTLLSVGMLDSKRIKSCFPKSSENIYIALDNCPNQKIVFCPDIQSDELLASLQQAGAMVDTLPFYYAYHTPLFSPLNKAMAPFYEGLKFDAAKALIYSCVSISKIPDEGKKAKKLLSSLLETQVNFQRTVETLYAVENIQTFIEVGPRNNISSFMNDTLQAKDAQVISTGLANVDEVEAFLQMLGQLFIAGKIHDISKLYSPKKLQTEPLKLVQESEMNTAKVITNHSLEQAAMLKIHFNLMQEFLLQQKRVMRLMQQLAEQSPDQKEYKRTVSPFLGELVSQDAKKASWVREVTLEKEPYLLDHGFGGLPSLIDKTKVALPIIPFTFSMETAVEAAVALAGTACVVQRVYDVRALRWFVYLGKPLKLEIQAQFLSETVIFCRVYNVVSGQKRLSFESKVEILRSNKNTYPISSGFSPIGKIKCPYHSGNFYLADSPSKPWIPSMFHGQAFQAVENIINMGNDGFIATIKILSKKNLFVSESAPYLMLDPIMIDASLQVTAYWAHSRYGVDLTILPFQIESYQGVGHRMSEGDHVTVKVKKQFVQSDGSKVPENAAYRFFDCKGQLIVEHMISDTTQKHPPKGVAYHQLYPETLALHSDVEYFDKEGNLFAKLEGWLDKHFSIPTIYNRFTDYPSWHFLSELNEDQLRLDMFDTSFLLSSGKIWLYKLAWLVFSTQEWDDWMMLNEEDGLHVLYQTIICKDLVRKHLLDVGEQRYAPVDLSCTCVGSKLTHHREQPISWLCSIVSKPRFSPLKVDVKQHDTYYTAKFSEV